MSPSVASAPVPARERGRSAFARVWAGAGLRTPLAELPAFVRRVEQLGFDGIAVSDALHDGPIAAAVAAGASTRLAVRTYGLVAFARSPMTIAVAAWDLEALAGGRFELGLGPLVRPILVGTYSVPWAPPAPRMREYIEALRAIFAWWQDDEPLHYVGKHYQLTRGRPFMRLPRLESGEPRIVVAGIGPRMTAVAGELADGIATHPTNADPRFLREITLPNLARGAARRGRDASQISITVNAWCATGATDADVQRSREAHRAQLATLYSTREYGHSLDLYGWGDLGDRLRQKIREGRWAELPGLVGDEMLDTFVPRAAYPELAALLRERYGGLAQEIGIPIPPDTTAHDRTIMRVIEDLKA